MMSADTPVPPSSGGEPEQRMARIRAFVEAVRALSPADAQRTAEMLPMLSDVAWLIDQIPSSDSGSVSPRTAPETPKFVYRLIEDGGDFIAPISEHVCDQCGGPMFQATNGAYRGLWACADFCRQFGIRMDRCHGAGCEVGAGADGECVHVREERKRTKEKKSVSGVSPRTATPDVEVYRTCDNCGHVALVAVDALKDGCPRCKFVCVVPPRTATDPTPAERVAVAAQRFCGELQEDSEGVPAPELAALHNALDEWEAASDSATAEPTTPEPTQEEREAAQEMLGRFAPRYGSEDFSGLRLKRAPFGSPEAPTPPTQSQESAEAYVAEMWKALFDALAGLDRETKNNILGAVHVQNAARRQLELANIFALRGRAESLTAEKASLSSRVAQLEAQLATQVTDNEAAHHRIAGLRTDLERNNAITEELRVRVAAMQATPEEIALLRTTAQEYEDSAHACDSPALRPMRRVRNLKAIGLRDLADKLSARSSLTEKPTEGT